MQNGPIITVEGLGKRYELGAAQKGGGYTALRDVVANSARNLFRRGANAGEATTESFWALKDVSFDIQRGEVVGIIGRNGAGKSTLLKILSRITEPTTGTIRLRGRVASLLEVGTGFHPELTGRENIFLNGAILGMQRAEIKAKFDEIVAFAEVERFLDTPVKRYSSGMYVRLAFAVAAHLEPEILIVDEVLAVGDAEFQKKCLGKIESVARGEGRTVLFVSHNMQAVTQMCSKAILLRSGVAAHGLEGVSAAIKRYAEAVSGAGDSEWVNPGEAFVFPAFKPERVYVGDRDGRPITLPLDKNDEAYLYVQTTVASYDSALQVGYELFSPEGLMLYMTFTTDQEQANWPVTGAGRFLLRSRLPLWLLGDGAYRVELSAGLRWRHWFCTPGLHSPAVQFEMFTTTTRSPYWSEQRKGLLAPLLTWDAV